MTLSHPQLPEASRASLRCCVPPPSCYWPHLCKAGELGGASQPPRHWLLSLSSAGLTRVCTTIPQVCQSSAEKAGNFLNLLWVSEILMNIEFSSIIFSLAGSRTFSLTAQGPSICTWAEHTTGRISTWVFVFIALYIPSFSHQNFHSVLPHCPTRPQWDMHWWQYGPEVGLSSYHSRAGGLLHHSKAAWMGCLGELASLLKIQRDGVSPANSEWANDPVPQSILLDPREGESSPRNPKLELRAHFPTETKYKWWQGLVVNLSASTLLDKKIFCAWPGNPNAIDNLASMGNRYSKFQTDHKRTFWNATHL